jgi:hypothetical protein
MMSDAAQEYSLVHATPGVIILLKKIHRSMNAYVTSYVLLTGTVFTRCFDVIIKLSGITYLS